MTEKRTNTQLPLVGSEAGSVGKADLESKYPPANPTESLADDQRRWWIYTLSYPSGVVKYVGWTINPKKRLIDHLKVTGKDRSKRADWIRGLKQIGARPTMEIVDAGVGCDWKPCESKWIRVFRKMGCVLVNSNDGGGGKFGHVFTEESKTKISRALTGRKFSDETRAKLGLAKRGRIPVLAIAAAAKANKGRRQSADWVYKRTFQTRGRIPKTRKFSKEDVIKIRNMKGKITMRSAAEMFLTSSGTISNIQNRVSYREIV